MEPLIKIPSLAEPQQQEYFPQSTFPFENQQHSQQRRQQMHGQQHNLANTPYTSHQQYNPRSLDRPQAGINALYSYNSCLDAQVPGQALQNFPLSTSFDVQSSSRYQSLYQSPQRHEENYQLRRKTPSGTIDAGYDGSHVYLAPGPPALKQVALPATTTPMMVAGPSYMPGPSLVQHTLLSQPRYPVAAGSEWVGPSPTNYHLQKLRGVGVADQAPGAAGMIPSTDSTIHIPNSFDMSNLLGPGQQPSAQSLISMMQQYGYGPPSPAIGAPFHASMLQPFPFMYPQPNVVMPQNSIYTQQHPHAIAPQPLQYTSVSTGALPDVWNGNAALKTLGDSLPHGLQYSTPSGSGLADFKPTSLDSISNAGVDSNALAISHSPASIFATAHRAYVLLLTHAHQSRKALISKGGSVTLKPQIFPKPPRTSPPKPLPPFSSTTPIRPGLGLNSSFNGASSLSGGLLSVQQAHYMPSIAMSPTSLNGNPPPMIAATQAVTTNPFIPQQMTSSPASEARAALISLTALCEQSGWKWVDGMILGGCLHFGLERYEEAVDWFQRAVSVDSNRVEAVSNLAVTMYALGHVPDAEVHWVKALRMSPDYLDSAEHLVGLIYNRRPKEAVDVVDYIQRSLKATNEGQPEFYGAATAGSGHGASGYSIQGCDNGRLIGLIHAKGSLLYSLKDTKSALEAFEEAVLISTGKRGGSIYSLVYDIQHALSLLGTRRFGSGDSSSGPLLLPEMARQTASLVFPTTGQLPGLQFVPDGNPKKAAIQTTSSSLLSLAKILQDSLSTGVSIAQQNIGVGDILALYYLSLSLQESPSTANNVGILLATIQQPSADHTGNANSFPATTIPGITPGSGLSFALAYYEYGLRLDPQHVHLHTNLGSLLKDIGQLDMAIRVYERAVSCDGSFDIALTNLANAVKDRGRIQEAIGYYKRAVATNPSFAEAVCGLFTALSSVCDWRGRGGAMLENFRFDRWHVNAEGYLVDGRDEGQGSGLAQQVSVIVRKQLDDASRWGAGTVTDSLVTYFASHIARLLRTPEAVDKLASQIRKIAGSSFEGSQIVRLIERVSRVAMWHWYTDRKNGVEREPEVYSRLQVPATITVPVTPTVLPFHTFTCPVGPADVRMISQRNAMRISCSTLRAPWVPAAGYPPPKPPSPQLIIGYVSSDFNNHPLAHLMQSVFGFHDASKFKAICYATTASDMSFHRKKIEKEAPVFRDVSTWSSDQLTRQISADGVHILVNLNGYTRGARNDVFAARPAPIQMSFMGFAGTMGAEWCDYLLADELAVPKQTLRPSRDNSTIDAVFHDENDQPNGDWIYSENLIFCRDTFFCCDHAQTAEPTSHEKFITWELEQKRRWAMRRHVFPNLADDTIIMGNFNQLYKIDPTTFRTWLRILTQCPKAVLWLLRFPELGEANLKQTAEMWAGADVAKRIIFTDVAQKQQHIFRARILDIFLDTAECNAHTTAADILWSSTPLITLPRYPYKMCSRMASSILSGALPKTDEGQVAAEELTVQSEDEYERTAVRLVNSLSYKKTEDGDMIGVGRLSDLRRLLFENKRTCALFDTRRWVRDLELAYTLAWEKWEKGESGDISL